MSIEGGRFLQSKYPDLPGSKPVERAVEKAKHDPERTFAPHSRDERITAYLDRLDYIIRDERGWRRLKHKLVNEFTIDTKDEDTVTKIAHGLYESEKRLAREQGRGTDVERLEAQGDPIEEYREAIHEKRDIQERTLSSWLEYLHTNDAQYPTWFRYFTVRNLVKMGTLNKEKGEYSKRTEHTIAPFPELNSEALGFVYRMLTTGVGHQEYMDEPEKRGELMKLVEKRDFVKLYTFAQIETAGALNRESIQGEWVKYEQNSDHHILENTLRGKGTGWCTAEGSAYAHLRHGDFYVYYTKGTHGTYSEPRIAIRMENNQVVEVRGVGHRQELEPVLVDIAQAQYHVLPGGEKFDKKSADMKRMTLLATKQEKGEPMTPDDLRFLYEVDAPILGFGYDRDPRIDEVREKRNRREDLATMADCAPEHLTTTFADLTESTEVFCEDTGEKITLVDFREEEHRGKLPQLVELAKHLKEAGSPAVPDLSFEGGIVSIDITPDLKENLKNWPSAKAAFEAADNGSLSWVYDGLREYPYTPLTATTLDVLILNHGNTTPKDRDTMVTHLDTLGYRPLTLAELIALGVRRPDFNKRNEVLNTYKPVSLGGDAEAPCLDWLGSERYLGASGISRVCGDGVRFLFVRK